jgi:TPR repeat protein
MYEQGQGVAQDYAEAARWYHKAADQQMHIAQLSLGRMYASGHGVARDPAEAARWYRSAADLGLASAQYELSVAYSSGVGVPADPVAAYQWMDLAVFRARGASSRKIFRCARCPGGPNDSRTVGRGKASGQRVEG